MDSKAKQPRELNVELLRIILMIMIVCHHFLMRGRGLHLLYTSGSTHIDNHALHGLFIDSFLIMTVNCFIFISGYYGIKFRVKTILSLFIQAITYSIAIDLIYDLCTDGDISMEPIWNGILSIPNGQWWFITAYFFLYLLSPFLNLPKKYLTKFQFLYILGVLTLVNFIVGFTLDPSSLGVLNGYSLFSFICLYFYGQAFNGYLDFKKGRLFYFSVYLICSLLIFTFFFVGLKYFSVDLAWTAFSYNNPLVLISAISFFFFFKSLKISYTKISFFSSSVLAVYLIHEHPVSAELLTQNLNRIALKYEIGNVYFTLFLIALLLFLCCTLVEKIRSAVTEPLLTYVISKCKLDRLDQKVNL
ncbi:acyltransferase [Pedobacter sp. L105]|uniref:acyltransferase family protein n=1 Tax=Pedobacter sp. L105 TaxID=1641871 RepID=UPI00131ECA35|nr:acyltransferase [Pedobacter sp. L105]